MSLNVALPMTSTGAPTVREPITYLYRCFDRDGQLLYAGVTDNVERRRREHAKDKFWWHDVTRVTRMAFQRRAEALWAEWAVITTCNPVYNGTAPVPALPVNVSSAAPVPGSAVNATSTVKKQRRTPVRPTRPATTDASGADPATRAARLFLDGDATSIREAARLVPGASEATVRRRINDLSDAPQTASPDAPALPLAAPRQPVTAGVNGHHTPEEN